ncbi:MAG: hypothetical protein HY807_00680 [Nitrospirae bacterium]|nr:hypothetical protein [Nitrospirota bacterium]
MTTERELVQIVNTIDILCNMVSEKWRELSDRSDLLALLVYGGEQEMVKGKIKVIPWRKLPAY